MKTLSIIGRIKIIISVCVISLLGISVASAQLILWDTSNPLESTNTPATNGWLTGSIEYIPGVTMGTLALTVENPTTGIPSGYFPVGKFGGIGFEVPTGLSVGTGHTLNGFTLLENASPSGLTFDMDVWLDDDGNVNSAPRGPEAPEIGRGHV